MGALGGGGQKVSPIMSLKGFFSILVASYLFYSAAVSLYRYLYINIIAYKHHTDLYLLFLGAEDRGCRQTYRPTFRALLLRTVRSLRRRKTSPPG